MNMTKKLYDEDAYATEFTAQVLSCEAKKLGEQTVYQVVLNQTLFFPEEGGQSPDTGVLGSAQVIDVQINNDVITHTVTEPLANQAEVNGWIDWEHRFSNMQQHTGEHIYSGLVHKHFGYNNVGFHLSDQIVTMDFDGPIKESEIRELEREANQAIVDNMSVEVLYPTKSELEKLSYRSKIDIDGQVRLVKIGEVDLCACCAPHVKHTGEVGMLKITSWQNYKGGVRLSLLCGFRAWKDACSKADMISKLGSLLSSKEEDICDAVTRLKEGQQSLKLELSKIKQEIMENKLQSIPDEQEDVILFETEMDMDVMRNAVNTLTTNHPGICGIFAGDAVGGYKFILGSKSHDMKETATNLRQAFQAKGGGSNIMIQGSVNASPEDIMKVLKGEA